MGESLPAISGNELIDLLVKKDGWVEIRHSTHGQVLQKKFPDRTRVIVIPTKSESLKPGVLAAILGTKQSCLGRKGLLRLLSS